MLSPTEDGLGVAARNPVLAAASDDSMRRGSVKTPVLGNDRAGQSVVDIVVTARDRRVTGRAGDVGIIGTAVDTGETGANPVGKVAVAEAAKHGHAVHVGVDRVHRRAAEEVRSGRIVRRGEEGL